MEHGKNVSKCVIDDYSHFFIVNQEIWKNLHALIGEELDNHYQDVWFSCKKGRKGHHELLGTVFISLGFLTET